MILSSDQTRWQDRTWIEFPAQLQEGQLSAQMPDGAKAGMLLVEDARGAIMTAIPLEP